MGILQSNKALEKSMESCRAVSSREATENAETEKGKGVSE